jgi:hypothetical protein
MVHLEMITQAHREPIPAHHYLRGSAKVKPSFSTTVKAEPTIEQLAEMVAHLSSDDHAKLLSEIARITQSVNYGEAMQLQWITDDPALTDGARSLMEQIGNYARKQP